LLAPVRPPVRPVAPREQRVPPALRHLFWNTAPAQLDVLRGGPYIARRLLRTMDLEGLAWGASNLRSADWLQAQKARGLDAQVRALARNLAATAGDGTKVEFLHADEVRRQLLLREPTEVAGLRVAALEDLMAMKLKVIGDRGEARDYFDVMSIDENGAVTLEDGIALFLERYELASSSEALSHLVGALGYLDDVEQDDSLPLDKRALARWWQERQPRLVRELSRRG